MIRHIVFFNAKERENLDRIIAGLNTLKAIPGNHSLEITRNMNSDNFSNEVEVVVYGEFADQDALDAYKSHQIYQDAIGIVRPLRDLRIAADVLSEKA